MEFPNLASTSVSLRGIFLLYASKDGSGVSLADLLDLAVLLLTYFTVILISLLHLTSPLQPLNSKILKSCFVKEFQYNVKTFYHKLLDCRRSK